MAIQCIGRPALGNMLPSVGPGQPTRPQMVLLLSLASAAPWASFISTPDIFPCPSWCLLTYQSRSTVGVHLPCFSPTHSNSYVGSSTSLAWRNVEPQFSRGIRSSLVTFPLSTVHPNSLGSLPSWTCVLDGLLADFVVWFIPLPPGTPCCTPCHFLRVLWELQWQDLF